MKKLPFLSSALALGLAGTTSRAQALLPLPRHLRATSDKGTRAHRPAGLQVLAKHGRLHHQGQIQPRHAAGGGHR